MPKPSICILGGTGFVGKHMACRLIMEGYPVKILTRSRSTHRELTLLPGIQMVETNIHHQESLNRHFTGTDVVINLVGILNEKGHNGDGFHFAHVELARKVVQACQQQGVRRLLHMSALHADASRGPSHYLASKGEAEKLVQQANSAQLRVTSFRPSVIFGQDDDFFNRFAKLLKLSPLIFPLACPESRFAPVYVGDVVEAFMRALQDNTTVGQTYELCGPHSYTLRELVQYTARLSGINTTIVGLNNTLSRLQARMLEWLPGKPFSRDNYLSLQVDSTCNRNGLVSLGITPTSLESIVPGYLANQNTRGCYCDYRKQARRGRRPHQ